MGERNNTYRNLKMVTFEQNTKNTGYTWKCLGLSKTNVYDMWYEVCECCIYEKNIHKIYSYVNRFLT